MVCVLLMTHLSLPHSFLLVIFLIVKIPIKLSIWWMKQPQDWKWKLKASQQNSTRFSRQVQRENWTGSTEKRTIERFKERLEKLEKSFQALKKKTKAFAPNGNRNGRKSLKSVRQGENWYAQREMEQKKKGKSGGVLRKFAMEKFQSWKSIRGSWSKTAKRKEGRSTGARSHRARNCKLFLGGLEFRNKKCFRKNFKNYVFWRNICTKRVVGQESNLLVASTPFAVLVLVFLNRGNHWRVFSFSDQRVGKTELSKALSEFLFSDENALNPYRHEWIHGTTFLWQNSLVLSGIYWSWWRRTTHRIRSPKTLFRGFVRWSGKSTSRYFHLLLQVLDDGRLTDSKGRTVDFKIPFLFWRAILVRIFFSLFLKWADRVPDQNSLSERDNAVFSVLRTVFRPEFLNRIDETIIFDPLRRDEMQKYSRYSTPENSTASFREKYCFGREGFCKTSAERIRSAFWCSST